MMRVRKVKGCLPRYYSTAANMRSMVDDYFHRGEIQHVWDIVLSREIHDWKLEELMELWRESWQSILGISFFTLGAQSLSFCNV